VWQFKVSRQTEGKGEHELRGGEGEGLRMKRESSGALKFKNAEALREGRGKRGVQ